MNKDKRSKKNKKKPAEKSGAEKKLSAYKSEGKNGTPAIEPVVPKSGPEKKGGGKRT